MLRQIPIGTDDFRVLRERNYEYVDKTHLITELVDSDNIKVVLLPRPRRFGKSLNLSTLKWFFEKRDEDVWHLFEGLHVARAGAKYRGHFQKYPVIHISLKETKAQSFDACLHEAKRLIRDMYHEHASALVERLDGSDRVDFDAILSGSGDDMLYRRSIKDLSRYLHQVHGVRPIVLIDEYDAGIHASYANGFYKETIGFFGGFFLAGLKDNVHLERAVMTGILRVSRESIFSDLNNLGVYTLLDPEFNTCFGFTEVEVTGLMEKAGLADILPAIRSYYNGYEFGGADIYNPWSILSFLARGTRQLQPHWVGTSSNLLIQELLQHHGLGVQGDMQTLLEGGYIERHLNENIAFPRLKDDRDTLWSLLVFSGYLKAARPGPPIVGEPPPPYRLSIPNVEVASVYRTTFQRWMDQALVAQGGGLQAMLEGMLEGDTYTFEEQLQRFAATLPSYHDVRGARPETFYHGMMIGLLASLEPDYEVRSNRESGEGRPDVLIKPRRPGKPGVVLELKAARQGEKTIEKAMAEGLTQLASSDYAAELRTAGVEKIREMAVAFDGKRVMVLPKGAKAPAKKAAAKKIVKKSAKKTVKKAPKKIAKKSATNKTVKKAPPKKVAGKAKKTR
ncbi:MAG: AAA family ATPase [Polyangiaceae bacterium]|nr:AAA family ATPase [Polyangiaceae bacterium]